MKKTTTKQKNDPPKKDPQVIFFGALNNLDGSEVHPREAIVNLVDVRNELARAQLRALVVFSNSQSKREAEQAYKAMRHIKRAIEVTEGRERRWAPRRWWNTAKPWLRSGGMQAFRKEKKSC